MWCIVAVMMTNVVYTVNKVWYCVISISLQSEVPLVYSAFRMSGYTPSQVSYYIHSFCNVGCSHIHTYIHEACIDSFPDLPALGTTMFLELPGLAWSLSLPHNLHPIGGRLSGVWMAGSTVRYCMKITYVPRAKRLPPISVIYLTIII